MAHVPVGMAEVARLAGVGRVTVSRVINGSGPVANETRQRVLEIASQLGYRPSAAARATVTGRTNCVALLASMEGRRSTLFPGLITGAHDALARHGMHLTFARVADEKLTDDRFVPKALSEWMADGLLINYNQEIPPRLVELINRHRVPAVWLNSVQAADCVYPDDVGAAREGAKRLLQLGHRNIAFVSYTPALHYSVNSRYEGYAQAMRSAGLAPAGLMTSCQAASREHLGDDCRHFTRSWLASADRPTAVLTYGVREVSSIFQVAGELGLQIPRDLSVLTLADAIQDDVGVPVSRLWVSRHELGEAGVEMLIAKINDPGRRQPPKALPFHFWQGATCGPCVRQ